MKKYLLFIFVVTTILLAGCGEESKQTNAKKQNEVLKVATLIPPMTDILEIVKPMMAEEGIELEIVVLRK